MTRANRAVFRSKSVALVDTLHMPATEVVEAHIRLAVEFAGKANVDRAAIHALLDDALAVTAVEGAGGGE